MTSLKSVTVNGNHTVVSVGVGASWLDVYTYLDALGLSVAGGRNGAVGVGGLTLGGGISYFAPRVGWACDTVVNFEVSPAFEPFPAVLTQDGALKGGNSLGTSPKDGNAVSTYRPSLPYHLSLHTSPNIQPLLCTFHTDSPHTSPITTTVLLLASIWSDSTSNALVEKVALKMMKDVADIASSMGLLYRFQYINYADPSQDPIASYVPENVACG